jgi:hypothetical protein
MPRDSAGVFDHSFTFVDDAANGVPYSPSRHDARFDDIKLALNDIPKIYPAGTDPDSVEPVSVMLEDGRLYICVENGDGSGKHIWREFGNPGITDASGFASITQVALDLAALVGDAPSNLNTLAEIADAINDDADYHNTVTAALATKSNVGHVHDISDVANLQSTLDGIANQRVITTTGTWAAFYATWSGGSARDFGSLTVSAPFTNEELATNRLALNENTSTTDFGSV